LRKKKEEKQELDQIKACASHPSSSFSQKGKKLMLHAVEEENIE